MAARPTVAAMTKGLSNSDIMLMDATPTTGSGFNSRFGMSSSL
jgi:hypothetical protein